MPQLEGTMHIIYSQLLILFTGKQKKCHRFELWYKRDTESSSGKNNYYSFHQSVLGISGESTTVLHTGNTAVTKTDIPLPRGFWGATQDMYISLLTLQALPHVWLGLVLWTTLRYRYDYPLFFLGKFQRDLVICSRS